MHDLVNDLASFVSGEFCLRMDDGSLKGITKKTRHLSCLTSKSHDVKKLEEYLSENKVLRTLLFESLLFAKQSLANLEQYLQGMGCLRVLSLSNPVQISYAIIPITTSLDLIGNLKLLKYLNLSSTDIKELPDTICNLYNLQSLLLSECRRLYRLSSSIGNLKHLRYLNLAMCSEIKEIPDSLCDLHDLHTLILTNCNSLSRLPTDMSRLVNLHYLYFFGTAVREMPPQMGKLKHLQCLGPAFLVDKNGGCNIRELGNLHDLRGSLTIENLENIMNAGDVREAKLKDKRYLTEVELQWRGQTDDSEKAREVLDGLQPHTNVQTLRISNYQGTSFPSWIGHQSFSHIISLSLSGCRNCYLLPPLGQLPSLKNLRIWGFEMVERIRDEFYYSCGSNSSSGSSFMINAPVLVPFKSLESLYLNGFSELREWKEWSLTMGGGEGTGAFPQLKMLQLSCCPKINGDSLPSNFPSHTTLLISEGCQRLVTSLQSHQLPWLGELKLYCCSGVVSFPPQGGLPSNIHTILIYNCHGLKSLAKQGWPSNLKSLYIESCEDLFVDVDSFPEEGQLPTTLTRLKLEYVEKLKSLNGKALRDLVCLKRLTINHCNQLQCLPEETLPDSLSWLNITSFRSLLADRCKRDTGEDWPKIAHIPRININGRSITIADSDEE
nr:putative disease resistance RPP13-like protein 1 isoform X1 [Ziziphus jujuba var. spinosa]XP_048329628.1 putative disease resistance RPP13-like protein 1 isoform X1 [Ziziphus jujuba var. spinosa]XP_048329629.1 putative disease resistance RPP13-like protein 1 isoform X1 [Ziziphus jujuba var. spinosa]XP_048329630.1 putative disease resistance RPP13-like protein 1 isoform X1 [Ziziphus jujuba var. spinosa]